MMTSKEEIINKICSWCAYQERSEHETYQKLLSWKLDEHDIAEIIQYLKEENYLNEKRFVSVFFHGKLNTKKWGIEKIKYQLKQKHNISDELIADYIKTIDNTEYLDRLKEILVKKKAQVAKKEKDKSMLKKKIINFALSKGYAFSDIIKVINEIKL